MGLDESGSNKVETHSRGELVDNKMSSIADYLRSNPEGTLHVWDALKKVHHFLQLNEKGGVCYLDNSEGFPAVKVLESRLSRFFLAPVSLALLEDFLENKAKISDLEAARGSVRTSFAGYSTVQDKEPDVVDASPVVKELEIDRIGRLLDVLDLVATLNRKFKVIKQDAGLLISCAYSPDVDYVKVGNTLRKMGYDVKWNDRMMIVEGDFSSDEEKEARRVHKFAVVY